MDFIHFCCIILGSGLLRNDLMGSRHLCLLSVTVSQGYYNQIKKKTYKYFLNSRKVEWESSNFTLFYQGNTWKVVLQKMAKLLQEEMNSDNKTT